MKRAETAAPSWAATPTQDGWLRQPRRVLARWKLSGPAVLGLTIVVLVVLAALLAERIAPADPESQHVRARLQAPWWLGGAGGYVLGSDHLGRDIFARVLYGSRVSLVVGVAAVAVAGGIGVTLGLLAGYFGGWWDSVIMRAADVQQAIPFLALAIAVVAILGPGLVNIILVLAVLTWVPYARVVRSEVLALRQSQMVEAARVVGASDPWIILRYLLPNVAPSIIVIASLMVANMITFEASLSFLGLGVPPPTPSWGRMVFDGLEYVTTAWWLSVFPGLAVMLTVVGINLVGDWLRDALDPRLRRR